MHLDLYIAIKAHLGKTNNFLQELVKEIYPSYLYEL